ncbi:MAG: integrase core domain-containing protein [Candidatus Omnitrophica bacterium]|nr:integrase core domain-containing protein [Candidatus Omnitrophota bacterium]MBU1367851.1 integrase core domain-containing protein [Candidatus Omnitrophota bacterium]MBU2436723.1 integrase core domain-containing protein [Candidatus Omnitrophota bacterium]
MALQALFLKHGLPSSIYADSHSIFRFVQSRDSVWRKHYLLTDEADTQWKQVLNDCNVKYIPALSPQAKGKVERPYRWLQDHIVRLCARENIKDIRGARRILANEVQQYNYHRVHSTTGEVPHFRFQRALKDKKSLFRNFIIKPPFQSIRDIFCIRIERTVNPYRKISINNVEIKTNHVPLGAKVILRVYANERTGLSEIRIWHNNRLMGIQKVKTKDLNIVHF